MLFNFLIVVFTTVSLELVREDSKASVAVGIRQDSSVLLKHYLVAFVDYEHCNGYRHHSDHTEEVRQQVNSHNNT